MLDCKVVPLEDSDPELAELLKEVVEINSHYSKKDIPIQVVFGEGVWYKGQFLSCDNKVGRNDICPCGSKLKFKKCCGK